MPDAYGRTINYLRLSITDRCNLRCRYCMPETGVVQKNCADILRYEEFLRIVTAATELGIRKIRVTGGEPLVRKGVIGFLAQLATLPDIDEVALTTNGMLLAGQAQALKDSGVGCLNVSLDSLNGKTYAEITRGGDLERVLAGLDEAQACGLKIKLNMVVMRGVNDHELLPFAALSLDKPWAIRFIEYMPAIREPDWRRNLVSGAEILAELGRKYPIEALSGGRYCGPAKPYRIAGALGTLGMITPMSEHFCSSCNRIRVTSTGAAKSCLFNDDSVDLKPWLNNPLKLRHTLVQVISAKPAQHHFGTGLANREFTMSNIGG